MNEPQAAGSLFRPGENCCAVAHADRAAFVVDGADYFAAFMAAAERAQRSIIMLAWDFDSRTGLAFGDDNRARATLGEFLNGLARRRRTLQIHVLDWDYPMIFGTDREFAPLYGFGWKRHRRVHFRFDDSHPLAGSHHQKIVVIDDRLAFVGGLDLTDAALGHARPPARRSAAHRARQAVSAVPRPDDRGRRRGGAPARPRSRASAGGSPPASGSGRSRRTAIRGRRRSPPDVTDVNVGIACTSPPVERPRGRAQRRAALPRHDRAGALVHLPREPVLHLAQDRRRRSKPVSPRPTVPRSWLVTRFLSHGWLEEMTMHVLRTRLIKTLRDRRPARPLPRLLPVHRRARGRHLHRPPLEDDGGGRRVAADRLGQPEQPLDGRRHRVRPRRRGAPADRRSRGRSAHSATACSASISGVPADAVAREIERTGTMHGGDRRARLRAARRSNRSTSCRSGPTRWSSTVALADPERPVSLESLVGQFAPDTGGCTRRRCGRPPVRSPRWYSPSRCLALHAARRRRDRGQRDRMDRGVRQPVVGAVGDPGGLHAGLRDDVPATADHARRRGRVRAMARFRLLDVRHPARRDRRVLRRTPASTATRYAASPGTDSTGSRTRCRRAGSSRSRRCGSYRWPRSPWRASSPARSASSCGTWWSARFSACCRAR